MNRDQLSSDIDYVKNLVDRAGERSMPASVYLLWAFIVLAGFSLIDLKPSWVALFWMIAGPLGGIVSGILGRRAGVHRGQIDCKEGVRHGLHWGGMMVFIWLAVMLAIKGLIKGELVSQVILLIAAFGWWTAGVHFDRNFLWLSGVMAAGFICSIYLHNYVWVGTGVLMFIALSVMGLRKEKIDAR